MADPLAIPPPQAPATAGPATRVGVYIPRPVFQDAKSAYLIDLDATPTAPGSLGTWVSQVISAHAQATPTQRAERAQALDALPELPPGTTSITQAFLIHDDTITAMNTAIVADRAHGRALSRSQFAVEAIRTAIESARQRSGGTLPPPPRRLPNNPAR